MTTKRKAVAITLALTALGFAGAAVFYSYLIGLNTDFPYLCPVCPDIVSVGPPTAKFVRRTIVSGTGNAIMFINAGWLLIGMVFGLKSLWDCSVDRHDE